MSVDYSVYKSWCDGPLELPPNRVYRSYYKGGALLEKFRNYPNPKDGPYPEDWIGSVIVSRTQKTPNEGLSSVKLEDNAVVLRDLIRQYPDKMLGDEHVKRLDADPFLLVKLLDSSVRLRVQVHPDRQKAKELLNFDHGKTEAWIILETRSIGSEPPYILLGFKEGATETVFRGAVFEQDWEKLEKMFHKVAVKPGDIFCIEAGTPHCIGPGVFMIEVQEPSDYTIYIEPEGKDLLEEGDANNLGLGWDRAFSCFNYEGVTMEIAMKRWRLLPKVIRKEAGGIEEALLYGRKIEPYFSARRFTLSKSLNIGFPTFYSAIIVKGEGRIVSQNGVTSVSRGQTLFMPAGLGFHQWENISREPLEIIACLPPS